MSLAPAIHPVGETSATLMAWRHRGTLRATVIAKATFAFASDGVVARVAPQRILTEEVTHSNSPIRSTRLGSDLAPYLPRPELLFTGRAFTGGAAVDAMTVRLGLFAGSTAVLDKSLYLAKPGGFTEMPLTYERAFGGVGVPSNIFGSQQPNIVDPRDATHPSTYAPIGSSWHARKSLLGALPMKAFRASPIELPDDFRFDFFQTAPADQWLPALRGDEWILLDGLHPKHPRLRMQLPGAGGLAFVHGLSPWGVAEGQPLLLHPDTLRIDGDEETVTLTYRGIFPVAALEALDDLRVVVGIAPPNEPVAWPVAPPPSRASIAPPPSQPPDSDDLRRTLSLDELAASGAETFAGTLALDGDEPVSGRLPFRGLVAAGERAPSLPIPGAPYGTGGASPIAAPMVEEPPDGPTLDLHVDQKRLPRVPVSEPSAPPPPPPPAPRAPIPTEQAAWRQDAPAPQEQAPAAQVQRPSMGDVARRLYSKFSKK